MPVSGAGGYTVAQTVTDWLDHGLGGRDPSRVQTLRNLAPRHVIPTLGGRKLREFSAEDVDRWLAEKSRELSTSTVARIKSILARSITRAQARDKVKRNVVLLCGTPTGRGGRPSQALTSDRVAGAVRRGSGGAPRPAAGRGRVGRPRPRRYRRRDGDGRGERPAGLPARGCRGGLDDRMWTPRELRHSFVSLLSDGGVPIEQIARPIGHAGGSKVTEAVYRKAAPTRHRRRDHRDEPRLPPPRS
ncbi:hypothetical protein GCM10009609_35990 [Pseudonocardia aurantiaca]